MTNESTTVEANDTSLASDSRVIDESSNSNALGRGVHLPEGEQKQEDAKPLSTREAIAKAFDDNQKAVEEKAKAATEDAKAKVAEAEKQPAPKIEKARAEDGKFAKAQATLEGQQDAAKADKGAPEAAASERAAPEGRESEAQRYREPPARFLPEAREKWANVPSNIKAEFHRVSQEMEAETAKYRESHERYESVRQYDEIARTNGRELKDSLAKVVEIEQAIARNPITGLEAVLREIGPRKADGSPLTLMEVAQHIVQNPQAYQQAMQHTAPQTQQAPQKDPEIEALRSEIQSMKAQAIIPVIDRFIDEHPDYHALEPQIEAILKSGVIEQIYGNGLSPVQKLAEAHRMAGGRSPSQSVAQQEQPAPVQSQPQARPVDPDGQKSIKGAPTNGQSAEAPKRFKSNRDALEAAFAAHAR